MKKSTLLLMIILISCASNAQTFQWAKKFESAGSPVSTGNYPCGITADATGNVYTTGFIQDTTDFDPGPNVFNLAPLLHHALYISKLDGSGNLVWAKSFGNANQVPSGLINKGYDIAVGPNGNVYITGSYSGLIDFDPGAGVFNLPVTTTNNYYYQRNFILKLDPNGNFIWAKDIGSSNSASYSFEIEIDNFGNIITSGKFGDTVDFDPGVGVFNLVSNGGWDVFISKLDSNGNFIWAKSLGSNSSEDLNGLALDANDNILITGLFYNQCDFDPNSGTHYLTAQGAPFNLFILKLNSSGSFKWAKHFGDSVTIRVSDIYCDVSDDVYTTGYFNGMHDFNPNAGVFNLSTAGNDNTFISKLDSNGNFAWANQFSNGRNSGSAITGDTAGNVFITGKFRDSVDFDPGFGSNILSSSSTINDLYITKLSGNGNFIWAKQTESGNNLNHIVQGDNLTLDSYGNIFTTGHFAGSVDFDPTSASNTLSSSVFNTMSIHETFVYKLKDCNNPTYASISESACDSFVLGHQVYTNSGTYNVVIANSLYCDSIITLNLTINSIDSSVSQNGTTLTANQTGASYQWINCDNYSPIIGATSQSYTVPINGNYAVIITNNDCKDTSACHSVASVNVHNHYEDAGLSIYPNPNNGVFSIEFKKELKECNLGIYNSQGAKIYQEDNSKLKKKQIDISAFSNGLYFVIIQTNEGTSHFKLIKK